MQRAFRFQPKRCIGCYACAVACKDKNNLPAGSVNLRRVRLEERGAYPLVSLARTSVACNHCARPTCIPACPSSAISKREADGVVLVDRQKCLGGDVCERACLHACPFGAPQFGPEFNPRMQKCDFCQDLLEAGEDPACAVACPMVALAAITR